MDYSMQIKDSTLRETSYRNGIHYLEIGDYIPVQYPTSNNNVENIRINKIFIATNMFVEGDKYSLFGKTFNLINKDIRIYEGDYIKATFDFSDLSLKLVNVSRIYFTPNTAISDLDYTHNKIIEHDFTDIMEIKIVNKENNDISINTALYVQMPKGTITLYLYCKELSFEPLNIVTYTSNMSKKYDIQNAFNITDVKANSHLTFDLKAKFIPYNEDEEEQCVMIDRVSGMYIVSKKIELDYPCYDDTFYYEEYDDHIRILYLKEYKDEYIIPKTIKGKPVTSLNQILFYNIKGDSIKYDGITKIEEGAFFACNIEDLALPKSDSVELSAYSFARSNIKELTLSEENNVEIVPYYCFDSCSKLTDLNITGSTRILEAYSFSNNDIENLYLGPCVEEVQKNAFLNTYTWDPILSEGLKIFYYDGTIYGNVTIPSTTDYMKISRLYGLLDYSNMNTPVTELCINYWQDYDRENKTTNTLTGSNSDKNLGFYEPVIIDSTIQLVDFGELYCDSIIINERSKDNPLTIERFNVKPYNQIPRFYLYISSSYISGSYYYTSYYTYLHDPKVIKPFNFKNCIFTKTSTLNTLSSFYITNEKSNTTPAYTTAKRYIFDPYLEYIPLGIGCMGESCGVYGRYTYGMGRTCSGNIMSIPATNIIRSHTFDNYVRYCGYYYSSSSKLSTQHEFVICKEIESQAFYTNKDSTSSSGDFYGSEWNTVIIGYGCEKISSNAFYGYRNLRKFTVPSTVTSIGKNAFYCYAETSATSVYIYLPDTLKSVGFTNSGANSKVTYKIDYYDATYVSYFTFKDSTSSSSITGFSPQTDKLYQYVVPENHNGLPVTSISAICNGKNAQNINEMIINAKITTIPASCFYNCSTIQRVRIPETVTEIGSSAFRGCLCLNRLEFYNCHITKIQQYAFAEVGHTTEVRSDITKCGDTLEWLLPYLSVNENEFNTDDYFRDEMSMYHLEITDDITVIGAYAFNASIAIVGDIKLPENSTYKIVEQYTFYKAPYITSLIVPETITTIKNNSMEYMYGCKEITIPDSTIIQTTFIGCERLVTINHTFNSLVANNFKDCHSLKHITLGNEITNIPDDCFNGCYALETITFRSSNIILGKRAFANCHNLKRINTDAIVSVGESCFQNTNLDEDIVEALMNKIEPTPYLFAGNINITEISLPKNVILTAHEFDGCINLTTITNTLSSVNDIPEYCFNNTSLDSSSVDKLLRLTNSIGEYAFSNNSNLDSISIRSNIENIGAYAFYNCSSLDNIDWISSKELSIPDYCFYKSPLTNCENSFKDKNISEFGSFALSETNMEKIYIPASKYKDNCFYNCLNLKYVYIDSHNNNELWLLGACFYNCRELITLEIDPLITVLHIANLVFEYCYKLELTPHDLYNKFTKVYLEKLYQGRGDRLLNIFNIFYDKDNSELYPEYEDVVITTQFIQSDINCEDIGLSTSSSYYYDKVYLYRHYSIRPFVGRIYKSITFLKDIPIGCFNSDSSYNHSEWGTFSGTYEPNVTLGSALYLDNLTLGKNLSKIGMNALMTNGTNINQNVPINIINNVERNWVIEDEAFYRMMRLYQIDLKNCTDIGSYAFNQCTNLVTVSNNNKVSRVAKYAFYYCSSLKNMDISYIQYFCDYSFAYCGIVINSSTKFSKNIKYLGRNAFQYCASVSDVVFDDDCTIFMIGQKLFDYCENFNSIHLPTTLIEYFCMPCELSKLDNDVRDLKYRHLLPNAFQYKFYYDGTYTYMDFSDCPVYEVDSNCKKIYERAFADIRNLDELIIPDTVEDLMSAFDLDQIIEDEYISELVKDPNSSTLSIIQASYINTLTFSGNRETLYHSNKNLYPFSYSYIITLNLPKTLKSIPQRYFYSNSKLTTINFNENEVLESIGDYAFYGCSSLEEVRLPQSCKSIGSNCFYSTKLKTIYLSKSCSIGYNAIPSSCTKIYYEDL